MFRQFSDSTEVDKSSLTKTWSGICLNENELKQILCLAGVYKDDSFALNKFVAVAAGFLTKVFCTYLSIFFRKISFISHFRT